MLVDQARIFVQGGRGGDGHVSFRREKFIPKGGPDGGDGGDGGSVILVALAGVDTLLDLAGRHHWRAGHGEPGGRRQRHGANGADRVVHLPPGTLVYDEADGRLLVDLDEPGRRIVIAQGGRGGFGNEHFKSPTNQTPGQSTPGEPGKELALRLELKLIADIGVVGVPNAGKSTLLAAISAARPKVADYPFTTLEPNLGIAELGTATDGTSRRLVLADIPGLIAGAALGEGLGTDFLRHIERTRILLHVLDVDPVDGTDPVENYHTVRRELAAYSSALAAKPQVIALNKVDVLGGPGDEAAAVELFREAVGLDAIPISAATGRGLARLLEACWLQAGKQPVAAWRAGART